MQFTMQVGRIEGIMNRTHEAAGIAFGQVQLRDFLFMQLNFIMRELNF